MRTHAVYASARREVCKRQTLLLRGVNRGPVSEARTWYYRKWVSVFKKIVSWCQALLYHWSPHCVCILSTYIFLYSCLTCSMESGSLKLSCLVRPDLCLSL